MAIVGIYTVRYSDSIIPLLKMNAFEDIYKYTSGNSSFPVNDCMNQIVNSFSENNQLYVFPLTFTIRGLNIYSEEKINKKNFSLSDLDHLTKANSYRPFDASKLFLLDNNRKFIDYYNLKSNFDTDDFISILDISKNCSNTQSQNIISSDPLSLYSVKDNFSYNNYYFTGIPSISGNDYFVQSDDLMMISKNSDNKDECLDFLKFLLDENTQKILCKNNGFPINKNLYQKYMYEITWETNEMYVQRVMNIIDGVHQSYIPDNTVMDIIRQNILSFEANEKSAEETAENIQSKVKLYMNESLSK